MMLSLGVDCSSMTDPEDEDSEGLLFDVQYDAIVPDSESVIW